MASATLPFRLILARVASRKVFSSASLGTVSRWRVARRAFGGRPLIVASMAKSSAILATAASAAGEASRTS